MDVTLVADALGPQLSGIGRYVLELSRRLPSQSGIDRVQYFAHGRYFKTVEPLIRGEPPVDRRHTPKWLRRRLDRRRLRDSVVHAPNYFLPPGVERGIITIHDLSVLRYPETHPAKRVREFERKFESSLARATHVITDSETIRREVIAEFGLSEAIVTSVPLGVAPQFHCRAERELEPGLAGLDVPPGRYALCVSTLEPRKKIAELIRAWRELPSPIRQSTPLVLAGAEGWLNDGLHADIGEAVEEGWLKHLGYVPDSLLPSLYAGAALFIYPSVYEGFGLPPLEAMASGVPVLVANGSCLPEICGSAAGYIEPDDVGGFSEAIVSALTDEKWRARARQSGLERAANFTWDRCAAGTAGVYRSVFR